MGINVNSLLSMAGVQAESMVHNGLSFIRRKTKEGYVYFISNLSAHDVNGWIKLSIYAPDVLIYDPYTHQAGMAKVKYSTASTGEKKTDVYLQLPSGYSCILNTTNHAPSHISTWTYTDSLRMQIPIQQGWTLQFLNGNPEITGVYHLQKLGSWTDVNDSARVFAGTALYQTTFHISAQQINRADRWILNLGQVDFSAQVFLNGHHVATLWAVPFACDITSYLRNGENVLQIQVTNLAANRIADDDRKKIPWKIFKDINVVNMQYRPFDASHWGEVPSGLIGPVYIEGYKNKKAF